MEKSWVDDTTNHSLVTTDWDAHLCAGPLPGLESKVGRDPAGRKTVEKGSQVYEGSKGKKQNQQQKIGPEGKSQFREASGRSREQSLFT